MLKNLILYRINGDMPASAASLEKALEPAVFTHCGKTQLNTIGWSSPRAIDHEALVESVGGQWMLSLTIEQRMLPASVVADLVDEKAEKIEEETGRKPGKKERKALKDEATLELLPQAFTKRKSVLAWIDPVTCLLAIDASSRKVADTLAGALVGCMPTMNLHMIESEHAPSEVMALWLRGEGDDQFRVARDGELRATDESKAVVRYQNHNLDSDEVRDHLDDGKVASKLALVYAERIAFTLTDSMAIKRVTILDVPMQTERTEGDDAFSANVAIITGELRNMLPALLEALGGERVLPMEAGDDRPEAPAAHAGDASTDPVYDKACAIVREGDRASISLVQRHLRIGYNRAARLIERMEAEGLVSTMDSNGARTVIAAGVPA